MITEVQIARINELYHKMKSVGLTPEEKEEQAILRGEYIASVRANMRSQLNNIDIQEADGTIVSLRDKAARKRMIIQRYEQ